MDGKGHLKVWKYGIIPAAGAALVVGVVSGEPVYSVGVVAGYLSGRWFDPDLDLLGLTNSEGRMMRELKIVGAVLVAWFVIYAWVMRFVGFGRKGHRNFFSHFPFVSTAIRIVWLLFIPAVSVWYFNVAVHPLVFTGLVGAFFGLSLADTLHFVGDVV